MRNLDSLRTKEEFDAVYRKHCSYADPYLVIYAADGTGKIGTLAGYTSSLFLGITGIWIIIEAAQRFFNPLTIKFNEAILIAIIGLIVNSICIIIMTVQHTHDECHHEHKHEHTHNKDYNFKAAYYHIMADALTSVLAIFALL